MERVATEGQIRALLGYPPKGDDEDFYEYVESYIGKDYHGGPLPPADFSIIWENHNKDVYDKQDALAERREAANARVAADKADGEASDKLIEERLVDPRWRNMLQVAKAVGVEGRIDSAFGIVAQNNGKLIEIDPDGRKTSKGTAQQYGMWVEDLDAMLADMKAKADKREADAEAKFQEFLAAVKAKRDRDLAERKEKAAEREAEFDREQRTTRELNERLREEQLVKERYEINLSWAKRRVTSSAYALLVARQQLASLESTEARSAFREEQKERYNPGGGGFTYDRRGRTPTEEQAKAVVLRCENNAQASVDYLARIEVPEYRLPARHTEILAAAADYPDDKSNRYYWTKKGVPKLKKLREWTDIMITKNERNALWPFDDIAEEESD